MTEPIEKLELWYCLDTDTHKLQEFVWDNQAKLWEFSKNNITVFRDVEDNSLSFVSVIYEKDKGLQWLHEDKRPIPVPDKVKALALILFP